MRSAADHGSHQFGLGDLAVYHVAAALLLLGDCIGDGCFKLLRRGDPSALESVCLRKLDKVRSTVEYRGAVALFVKEFLPSYGKTLDELS